MTEWCWFDSMVFSVFSNDLTWVRPLLTKETKLEMSIHARPCKRILSLSTPCQCCHSKAVEDLVSLADPCTACCPFRCCSIHLVALLWTFSTLSLSDICARPDLGRVVQVTLNQREIE
jgi:hypothetical protein